jgi:lipopolysaccharide biosynthesis glycosyltransferase
MVNIMICGNTKVGDGLFIVSLSYAMHNKEAVTIYYLTMDLSQENPSYIPVSQGKLNYLDKMLKKYNPESSIKAIDVKDLYIKYFEKQANKKSSYTPYAVLRLLADLIPEIPDRILYLDTDTLVAKDISSFFHMDMEDYEFAASKDMMGRFFINPRYQNSGVLLMNMALIRKTGLLEQCRYFVNKRLSLLPDQDALNKYVRKKKFLSMDYNRQGRPNKDTIIKHFPKTIVWYPIPHIRNVKPWQVEDVHRRLKYTQFDDVLNEFVKDRDEFHSL